MNKVITILSTIAMAGMTSIGAMAPAFADDDNGFGPSHPNMAGNDDARGANGPVPAWCNAHPFDPNCHTKWSNAQSGVWYHHHRHDNGFDPLAAGVLGFAAGAIIAGAAASAANNDGYYGDGYLSDDHVAACREAYRSYQISTDTYLGYDGYRHPCEL